MAATDYFNQIQQLYVAYFGRPADPEGLSYWAAEADTNGSLGSVIANFAISAESNTLFGNLSTKQLVTAIYANVFSREPEAKGLAYWTSQIESGAISSAQAAWTILQSAGTEDTKAVQNKLAAANAFTANVDTSAEISGYSGAKAANIARAFLAKIDSTSYSTANLATDAVLAVAAATGIYASSGPMFTATKDGSNVVTFTNSGLGISVTKVGDVYTFTSNGTYAGSATVAGPISKIVLSPSNASLTISSSLADEITLPNGTIRLSDTTELSATLLTKLELDSTALMDATRIPGITAATVDQAFALLVTNNGTTGDKIWTAGNVTVAINNTSASASDLNAINAKTTGLITADSLTSISGKIADVKTSLEAITSGASLSATGLASVTLTDKITLSDLDNVVFANNATITLADVASNSLTAVDTTVGSGKTLTIDGSGLTGSNFLLFRGMAETNGSFIIKGGAGADNIAGGKGVDIFTGGGGNDFFGIGTGGSLIGSGGSTNIDKITDFNAGSSDTLGFQNGSILLAADNSAIVAGSGAGSNIQQSAGGKITFDAADNILALKVAAIQADTQLHTAGATAFFEDGGNTYVYFAGATTASSDDELVQLTGVINLSTITINDNNYISMN